MFVQSFQLLNVFGGRRVCSDVLSKQVAKQAINNNEKRLAFSDSRVAEI